MPVHCMHRPPSDTWMLLSPKAYARLERTTLLTKIACEPSYSILNKKKHAHAISYLLYRPAPRLWIHLLGSLLQYRHHSTWQTTLLDALTTEVSESQSGGAEPRKDIFVPR